MNGNIYKLRLLLFYDTIELDNTKYNLENFLP